MTPEFESITKALKRSLVLSAVVTILAALVASIWGLRGTSFLEVAAFFAFGAFLVPMSGFAIANLRYLDKRPPDYALNQYGKRDDAWFATRFIGWLIGAAIVVVALILFAIERMLMN